MRVLTQVADELVPVGEGGSRQPGGGSFLSDNVFLLATLVAAATLVALVAGLAVSRARGCGDAIPFVSRDE